MSLASDGHVARAILALGGVAGLLQSLSDNDDAEARESILGALRNIFSDSENRASVASAAALRPLIQIARSRGSSNGRGHALAALCWLSLDLENAQAMVFHGAVSGLMTCINSEKNSEHAAYVAGIIRNLSSFPANVRVITTEGGIPVLVDILKSGAALGQEHAAAALTNLATLGVVPPLGPSPLYDHMRHLPPPPGAASLIIEVTFTHITNP